MTEITLSEGIYLRCIERLISRVDNSVISISKHIFSNWFPKQMSFQSFSCFLIIRKMFFYQPYFLRDIYIYCKITIKLLQSELPL